MGACVFLSSYLSYIAFKCVKLILLRGRSGFDAGYKTCGACRDGDQSR